MGFIGWIVSMMVVIAVWEANHMGLDWHGSAAGEWLKWGTQGTTGALVTQWSYRVGPLEIFKMV